MATIYTPVLIFMLRNPLNKDSNYSSLNKSAAKYSLTTSQVREYNKFFKSKDILYQSPWLDAIWLSLTGLL